MAQTRPSPDVAASATVPTEISRLAPPPGNGPVVVRVAFRFYDVGEINEGSETFEFTGVLTLEWVDPRMAFDAARQGVAEKVYQGAYQFNELAAGWYPQIFLVNEAGSYEKSAVVLRVARNGASTLIETINATAEIELGMRRFPFDRHRLEAVFEVLGFDRDEVLLQVAPDELESRSVEIRIPQWVTTGSGAYVRDRSNRWGVASAFVASVDVDRDSFHVIRLVVFPLVVIVLLSFSVFWMDRSSLGDRLSISFIGILTGVAYQMVISDSLPSISYFTLIHGFLNLSFVMMCATVVINLVVSGKDRRGEEAAGDRIDQVCRWAFPTAYFGLILMIVVVASTFF